MIGAFASGNILQVLLFAVTVRLRPASSGRQRQLICNVIDSFSRSDFLRHHQHDHAPGAWGAFGAMAFTIGKYGVGTWCNSTRSMCFYITCIPVRGGERWAGIARGQRLQHLQIVNWCHKKSCLIVLLTRQTDPCCRACWIKWKLGCKKSVVGLVIPDRVLQPGRHLYLPDMATVFIAQATNTHGHHASDYPAGGTAALLSKGRRVVTGSGLSLAATISAVGHLPLAGLALDPRHRPLHVGSPCVDQRWATGWRPWWWQMV